MALMRFFLLIIICINVYALPTYSRQTGYACDKCHVGNFDLTSFGRSFKLLAYQLTNNPKNIPISFSAVISQTHINSRSSSLAPDVSLPKNDAVIFESGTVYLAGRYLEHVGGDINFTLNKANINPIYASDGVQIGTHVGSDFFLDRSQIRFINKDTNDQLINVGATINNAPGVQDPWLNVSKSDFLFQTSGLQDAWEIGQFGPATQIDGSLDSQVTGISLFGIFNKHWYLELTDYGNFHDQKTIFQLSGPRNTFHTNYNPYWRFAVFKDDANESHEFGFFGMATRLGRDIYIPGSAGALYNDYGIDTKHMWSVKKYHFIFKSTIIQENMQWGYRSVGRSHDNQNSSLNTARAMMTVDYDQQMGISGFVFRTDGSTDKLYYAYNQNQSVVTGACNQNNSLLAYCSINGSPKTTGGGFEIYYSPYTWMRLVLQETFYTSFLGGGTFIDNTSGNLRSASDNNLTYIYTVLNFW